MFVRVLDGAMEATVRFTPPRRGPYHLALRFEPNLGLLQTQVNVAEDRRDAGHRVFAVDRQCEQVALAGDTLLCLADGQLMPMVNGDAGEALTAAAFWPTSNGAWVIDPGAVLTHAELDDGGWLLSDSIQAPDAVPSLVGADDRALLNSRHYFEVVLDGGALVEGDHWDDDRAGFAYLEWTPGEEIFAISNAQSPAICRLWFDGATRCTDTNVFGIGVTRDGLWFNRGTNAFGVVQLDDAGVMQTSESLWAGPVQGGSVVGPLVAPMLELGFRTLLPRLDPAEGLIYLEDYGTVSRSWIGADDQCLWIGDNTTVECIERR